MFVLKKGTYVAALWVVPLRDAIDIDGCLYEQADWLATLYRIENESVFRCNYRFRYYIDDKAHDSDDKKSAYGVKFNDKTEAEAMVIMNEFAEHISSFGQKIKAEVHKLIVRSDDPQLIIKILQTDEFFHMAPKDYRDA